MGKYILAHDLGTTGNKATLYNYKGDLIGSTFSAYDTFYPHLNWAEQNPLDWWHAVCESTKKLIADKSIDKKEIAVISFSGQMMGCLPIDKEGNALCRSIIWADQRSIKQADRLESKIGGQKIYKITGHRVSPSYSIEKIMWLMDNEPDIYAKTYKFLHAKDYVVLKLTGEFVTDYSDVSGMNLFDITKKEWSEEIIFAAGVDKELFPEVHSSFDVVGEVRKGAAKEIGLSVGTPVVIGAGDGPAASVGAAVVKEGKAYNYIGSSSWIALATNKPILDPEEKTFNWIHADPEMYMPCGTMQTAGASYNWLKNTFCQAEIASASKLNLSPYELMNLSVEKSIPGAKNLIYLPYLLGERSPHWNPNAKGAFIGLTMRHTRQDIMRSVLEGVTFNLKFIAEIFENRIDFSQIRVIGGGAKGKTWRKIMADIYDKEVLRPEILQEATSLGAAIIGGVGVGIFDSIAVAEKLNPIIDIQKPCSKNTRKYQKLYPIFKEAYQDLIRVYDSLSKL
ncbi:MAG: xylulokinase [Firmicutes bacterium]|nr:xylulokinase [Bacillota bacterium]